LEKQGFIEGVAVRYTSWEAILWEYFYYLQELPYADRPLKDKQSYLLVRTSIGEAMADEFLASQRA
jgi:aminoglycoside 2''-adenylyltransferase